jgi:hypothetical protein
MGRKRKMKDPLGLERASRSMTLSFNKMRGRMAEDSFEMSQRLQGREVRKIHKGGDFVVRKGGRDKPTTYEIKTGDSELSEAQERKKRRLGRRYKVVRY